MRENGDKVCYGRCRASADVRAMRAAQGMNAMLDMVDEGGDGGVASDDPDLLLHSASRDASRLEMAKVRISSVLTIAALPQPPIQPSACDSALSTNHHPFLLNQCRPVFHSHNQTPP